MSLRKVPFAPGEYYHIYNRGNSKQTIFHDKADYDRFLKLLFLSNGEENFKVQFIGKNIYEFNRGKELVHVGAYCLMPNHFHLLLTQAQDGGISKFIQKLSTGYSMYYNKKYERSGTLFEGKFKSQHAGEDNYMKYLFSYIHLNPIKLIDKNWKERGIKNKTRAISYLEKYRYSSFVDYLGWDRLEKKIINPSKFPDYFSKTAAHKNELFEWLDFN